MERLNLFDWISLVLVWIGGLQLGLLGIFQYDMLATIFADSTAWIRTAEVLVGIGFVYSFVGMLVHALGSVGQFSSSSRHQPTHM